MVRVQYVAKTAMERMAAVQKMANARPTLDDNRGESLGLYFCFPSSLEPLNLTHHSTSSSSFSLSSVFRLVFRGKATRAMLQSSKYTESRSEMFLPPSLPASLPDGPRVPFRTSPFRQASHTA